MTFYKYNKVCKLTYMASDWHYQDVVADAQQVQGINKSFALNHFGIAIYISYLLYSKQDLALDNSYKLGLK